MNRRMYSNWHIKQKKKTKLLFKCMYCLHNLKYMLRLLLPKKKKKFKKKINKMLSKINYVIRKFKRIKHVIN